MRRMIQKTLVKDGVRAASVVLGPRKRGTSMSGEGTFIADGAKI